MTVKLIQMLRCTRFAILQSAQSRMQFRPILNHALQCNVVQGSMDVVQRRTTVCLYKELQDPDIEAQANILHPVLRWSC